MTRTTERGAASRAIASALKTPVVARDRQRTRALGPRSPDKSPVEDGLYSLKPSAIWKVLKRQPPSFWLVCIYLFFEYIRPQQIYEAILGPPYTRIVVILAFVAFLLERRTLRFRTPEFFLAIFSVVVLASSVMAYQPSSSYDKLFDYFSWVLIYVLIANVVDTEERFLVFLLSFLLYSFRMSEFGTRSWVLVGFSFQGSGITGSPSFFQNSGDVGVQMCIFLPLIVAFILALGAFWPRWMRWVAWGMAGTAVTAIVASSSRGAVVGMAAVGLWGLLKSRQKVRSLFAVVMLAGLVFVIIPQGSKLRFESAGEDRTSVGRLTMWKHALDMMANRPLLGVGYKNWVPYHDAYYGGHGTMTHNIFLEAGSELGYTGLAAFLALIGCTFVINSRTRKLAASIPDRGRFMFFMAHGLDGALVGLLASGFFTTVLYYPFFWINFAMTVALHNAVLHTVGRQSPAPSARRDASARGGMRTPVRAVS
jgi:putative inorganic carbon (HCO3(-)) transporter